MCSPMRCTRPGACACHVSEGTKLGGGVLGSRVEDERARSKLGACEVLELVACAVRRVELDVEVVVARSATGRSLMHRHDIRKGRSNSRSYFWSNAFRVAANERSSSASRSVSPPRWLVGGR